MPNCPNCGNRIISPSRLFSVIVEPKEGERGLTERKVGMYHCTKCETKFPAVISRQHYLIVAEDRLKDLESNMKGIKKENEDLQKKVKDLEKDYEELQKNVESTKKEGEMKELILKLDMLEQQVDYLRKEKSELENRISKFH